MSRQAEKRSNLVAGAIALLLGLLLVPATVQAREGFLDPSFGSAGRVITPLRQTTEVEPAIGPDGSIAMLSRGQIVRFLPNGSLDAGFGEGGQLALPGEVDGLDFTSLQVVFDSLGRLIVFGFAEDPTQEFYEPLGMWSVEAHWAVVLRLTPDGTLDESFGEGKGFIRSDFGVRSDIDPQLPLAYASEGRLDQQDRPVLMLRVALSGSPRCDLGKSRYAWYPRAIVRLTAGGALDPTFGGGDGTTPISGNWDVSKLRLDAGGGPTAAVGTGNCRLGGNRIFRFDAAGAPLPGFDAAKGRLYRLYMYEMEPSGGMILARSSRGTGIIARTLPNGEPDRSFGTKGRAVVRMPFGTERTWRPVGVDAQQRILLVGSFNFPKPKKRVGGWSLRSFLTVGRLTASGKPDLSFGKRGWIITRFKRPRDIDVEAALDPQGRLVAVVGSGSARQLPGPRRIVLTRYLLEG